MKNANLETLRHGIICAFICLINVFCIGQSVFNVTATTATSVSGDVTSAPGCTFNLNRTFQNGFTNTVDFTPGTTSGIQLRNNEVFGNSVLNPDQFAYDFVIDTTPCCSATVIIKRIAVDGQTGTAECTEFTVTWPGGGLGTLIDPNNEFTSHANGATFPSGTVLTFSPGPSFTNPCSNLLNTAQQWSIEVPASSVSVDAFSLEVHNIHDMMYNEWLAFDAIITPIVLTTFDSLSVCPGTSVTYPDGVVETITANTSHVSSLLSVHGCDSIVTTNVTVYPIFTSSESISVCPGTNVTYPDGATETITSNTSHISSLLSVNGCDSIITTNVTVYPTFTSTESISVCPGTSVTYPDGVTETINANSLHVSSLLSVNGCDSIITTNVVVYPTFTSTESISVCPGTSVTYPDGVVETITANTSHVSSLLSVHGCDSIVTTNVTVYPTFTSSESISVCPGTSVTYPDGVVETITANTSHVSSLLSVNGCDSIVTTNVTVYPTFTSSESISVCPGTSVTYPDGVVETITANTSHVSSLLSVNGCDSIVTTNVTVYPTFTSTESISVCPGTSVTYPDGATETITANTSHVSSLLSVNGCDSIVTTNVTVSPTYTSTESISVCPGTSVTYPDGLVETMTANTTHISSLLSVNGCDSIVTTNVTVYPIFTSTESISVCPGTSVTYPDGITETITSNTSHISSLLSVNGCDSIITTNVVVYPTFISTESISVCPGTSVTYPDGVVETINANTSHVSSLLSVNGCDSIITTNVTVYPTFTSTESISVCPGTSVTYPDGVVETININTSHISALLTVDGCDSTITTNVLVVSEFNVLDTILVCPNETVIYADGVTETINASTNHVSNLISSIGCDSIVTTTVVMMPAYSSSVNMYVCPGEAVTYPDGVTEIVNTSTTHISSLNSTFGCDSLITTNVDLHPTYASTESFSVCPGTMVVYPDGVSESINSNTTHLSVLTSMNGCDSLVTTTVSLLPVYSSTEDVYVCPGSNVTFPDGSIQTMNTNVVHVSSLSTIDGCDSIITTNVTVLPTYASTENYSVCPGTQVTYPDGVSELITTSTTHLSVLQSLNGCDSIITTVVDAYTLPLIDAGQDTVLCEGESIVLTASGGVGYIWSNGGNNNQVIVPPAGTSVFYVSGWDVNNCVSSDSVVVLVNVPPAIDFSGDILSGCETHTVHFTSSYVGSGDCFWNFGNGQTSQLCSPEGVDYLAGLYSVTLTVVENGCSSELTYSDYISVVENPVAMFTASENTLTTIGTPVQFTNQSVNADAYLWDFGDNSSLSELIHPSHYYEDNDAGTVVTLWVYNTQYDCVDSAVLFIPYLEDLIYYVPNTFTPDDDEFNQDFYPVFTAGYDPYDYHLTIFNRWGEIIFESYDANVGWDGTYGGKLVQDGTYTWVIEFMTLRTDERIKIVGHVNVIQ